MTASSAGITNTDSGDVVKSGATIAASGIDIAGTVKEAGDSVKGLAGTVGKLIAKGSGTLGIIDGGFDIAQGNYVKGGLKMLAGGLLIGAATTTAVVGGIALAPVLGIAAASISIGVAAYEGYQATKNLGWW